MVFLFFAFTFEWWKCYFSLYKEIPLFENVINIRKKYFILMIYKKCSINSQVYRVSM